MIKHLITVFFCICINTSCRVYAQSLTYGYIEIPPFTYTNENGKADGFIIDIVDQTFKKANIEYIAISLPAIRLREYLKSGKVDIWAGVYNANDYDDVALVGNKSFSHLTLNAYFIGDKPAITQKEQLKNQSIITIHGYSYAGLAEYIKDSANNISDNKTKSHESAFNMLKAKRGDYLLGYYLPAQQYLTLNPIAELQRSLISPLPLYFIVSKRTPNAQQLLDKLETLISDQAVAIEPSKHHP